MRPLTDKYIRRLWVLNIDKMLELRITKQQKLIITSLRSYGAMKTYEIADDVGLGERRTLDLLNQLVEKGYVIREKDKNTFKWSATLI